MAKHSSSPHDFESALAEIDRLVSTMESGRIPLDEALRAYERGVELLKYCRAILDGAEERLKIVDQSLADTDSTAAESDT